MNTTSLSALQAAQQAAKAALTLYRAGFQHQAESVWRSAISIIQGNQL